MSHFLPSFGAASVKPSGVGQLTGIPNVHREKKMADLIAQQPDDSSYDEILRQLAYARMVDRGLADSVSGHVISDDEFKLRIEDNLA